MHLPVDLRRAAADSAKELLAEEEEPSCGDLRSAHRPDGVLHLRWRCVGTALDLEVRKVLLKRLGASAELPTRLSGLAKLDAERPILALDGRCVILCHDVVVGKVHSLSGLVVELLED